MLNRNRIILKSYTWYNHDLITKWHFDWIFRGTAFFFLLGMLFSTELWIRMGAVPLIPVFQLNYDLIREVNNSLTVALSCCLIWIIIRPNKTCVAISLSTLTLLIVFDELKAQPWVYQYGLFLLPISFKETIQRERFYVVLLSGIYILSGLSKLNPQFVDVVLPMMINSGSSLNADFMYLGYSVGLVEAVLGVSLLIKKWKGLAIYMLILMHVVLIIWIGWFSLHDNVIVIPWNFAMMYFLVWLKINRTKDRGPIDLFKNMDTGKVAVLSLILFLVPVLTRVYALNQTFRFNMYSSGHTNLYLAIGSKAKLLPGMANHKVMIEGLTGGDIIDMNGWINTELGVPIPSHHRFYGRFTREICKSIPGQDMMYIIPKSDRDVEYLHCEK